MLEKEYAYYEANKAELIQKYRGRFIVVIGESVVGNYASQHEAIEAALKDNAAGTFLVQECTEESDQVMRFHSRVSFPLDAQT